METPKNLGWTLFQTLLALLAILDFAGGAAVQEMRRYRRCSVASIEQEPPLLLGWYYYLHLFLQFPCRRWILALAGILLSKLLRFWHPFNYNLFSDLWEIPTITGRLDLPFLAPNKCCEFCRVFEASSTHWILKRKSERSQLSLAGLNSTRRSIIRTLNPKIKL